MSYMYEVRVNGVLYYSNHHGNVLHWNMECGRRAAGGRTLRPSPQDSEAPEVTAEDLQRLGRWKPTVLMAVRGGRFPGASSSAFSER